MMHVLSCDHVREHLQAWYDGELPVEDQVLIQAHLRDCVACALEADAIEELGEALREMAAALPARAAADLGRLPAAVLERLRIEEQFSLRMRLRDLFEDMHLVWAALGATAATVVCLMASMGVLQAANRENPESLAGVISVLANPGSNANPVRLNGYMEAPRAVDDLEIPVPGGEAVFAMQAVVSREGRVQNIELLLEQQARTLKVKPEVLLAMLEAASRTRFVPAQAGGAPVAVSVVWLVANTTVTGSRNFDIFRAAPARWSPEMLGPELERPKPVGPVGAATKPAEPSTEA
ncbi:MAG: zf-HC2 domain-containing protein [Acidobacteriota bacterium]